MIIKIGSYYSNLYSSHYCYFTTELKSWGWIKKYNFFNNIYITDVNQSNLKLLFSRLKYTNLKKFISNYIFSQRDEEY